MLAHVGLTLIGEGEAELDGVRMPSGDALARAGLAPVTLGPKDGLAICSSSAVSAGGRGAGARSTPTACLEAMQVAAALSMEGFRANLSPLDPRVVAARPAPGPGVGGGGAARPAGRRRAHRAGRSPPAPGPDQPALRQPDPRLAARRAGAARAGGRARAQRRRPTTRWSSPATMRSSPPATSTCRARPGARRGRDRAGAGGRRRRRAPGPAEDRAPQRAAGGLSRRR